MAIQGRSMTSGQPWKHILRFALPVLAGSLLQQLYNTVDTIIVGKFASEEALAAVGTTASFTFLFLAIVNIILSMYVPLFGVFQGSNHGGVPTIVATGALSTRVLVTFLFKNSAFFGYSILWWNGLFGFGLGFMIAWTYFLSGRWKKNSTIE